MVRLGWMQDAHIEPNNSSYGVGDALWQDHNTLDHTYNVDDILWTGDQVAPSARQEEVPHVTPEYYERFWGLVEQADNPDLVRYAIPGNHDCPLGMFLESDERAVLRAKIEYDDGVTVLMVNAHTTALSTGSPGNGIGHSYPMASYSDLKWLDEELAAAENRGDAKIVLPHAAPVKFDLSNGSRDLANRSRYIHTDTNSALELMYETCLNQNYFHSEILSNYTDVVVPCSHIYTTGTAQDTFDGVHYLHTAHYWDGGSGGVTSFQTIDATSSGVTVTEIDHSTGSETTVLDVTL